MVLDSATEKPNKEISRMLLDIYSEKTGLPVALYLGNKKYIWSGRYWSDFCKEMRKLIDPNCGCDMEYFEQSVQNRPPLRRCFAGLWAYYQPIKVDGKEIATLVTGPTRISENDHESKKILENLLESHHVENSEREKMIKLYEQIPAIAKEKFDAKLLEHLSYVERYIRTENQRVSTIKNMISNLAHEFLLPIQAITAKAENLYDEARDPALQDMAEDIVQEMTKLYFIAENIRGSIFEPAHEEKYEFVQYSLYKPLIEAVELFQKEANTKGIIIKKPISRIINFPLIEMSPPHIRRVFFNLIHNAVKYSFASTSRSRRDIEVIGYLRDNFYCVEISNYGIGIKPHEIAKGLIFLEGHRGELARDTYRTGSGIGLASVKKIIEAHRGKIEIESRLEGHSEKELYKTTVRVCLPFTQ